MRKNYKVTIPHGILLDEQTTIERNLRKASRDRNYRRSIFGLAPLPDA